MLGVAAIVRDAADPVRAQSAITAMHLFVHAPWVAFVALGSVVLAVTGCEALYADMGHFGRSRSATPGSISCCPRSLLNYFGQGADGPAQSAALTAFLFYDTAPHWAHYPLVLLATVATVIASQAVISGVYSITQQAVQLGQLPRMEIRHTSATDYGQIYVPRMNADPCHRRRADRAHLPEFRCTRRRLRHCGHRRDGDQHVPRGHCRRAPMGMELALVDRRFRRRSA